MLRAGEGETRCRRAVVTGASGYVGVNLVRELLTRDWEVRTYSRRPPPVFPEVDVEHHAGDIRDIDRVGAAVKGADVVFNLAAKITLRREDEQAWNINTLGPATVARAALDQGVGRVVHCSSVHAFDLSSVGAHLDEQHPRSGPTARLYDRSKATGESAIRTVAEDGLEVVVVNPTGVIGPVDVGPSRMNAILLSAARGHLPIAVAGGFDWVDVRDVARGIVAAAELGQSGENYLLGGHRSSVVNLARLAARMNDRRGPFCALPPRLAQALAPIGELLGRLWRNDMFTPASIETLLDDPIVDSGKARQHLNFTARPLEETVRDLVVFWRQQGHLKPRRRRSRASRRGSRELSA